MVGIVGMIGVRVIRILLRCIGKQGDLTGIHAGGREEVRERLSRRYDSGVEVVFLPHQSIPFDWLRRFRSGNGIRRW